MKIGMLFECTKDGPDYKVCTNLAKRIWTESLHRSGLEIVSDFLDNKPKLVAGCGTKAAHFLKSGVEHVFIVWDLFPSWRRDEKPCRHQDRLDIFASLDAAGVPHDKVTLLCIEEELEAWLLADGSAIERALSRPAHPISGIGHESRPDAVKNPKEKMARIFRTKANRTYNDFTDAEKIIRQDPSLRRLAKSTSFARFQTKLSAR
ncbi:MAG TPA: hypothetical protein PK208_04570 [Fibrobacteria bacterium]|nr:hypothetical protein [Fibrobacteria bacterium]